MNSEDFGKLKLRLGEWDISSDTEVLPHQEYSVEDVIIHENYGTSTVYNDFALLFLSKPAMSAPFIDTICLPPATESYDVSNCIVSGWGQENFSNISPLIDQL